VARESRRVVTAVRGASPEEVLHRLQERLTMIFAADEEQFAEARAAEGALGG
jgi:hypothetical protein